MSKTILLAAAVFAALSAQAEETVLFDFEDAGQLAAWAVTAEAEVSTEWASQGSKSLKIAFPQYEGGKTPDFPQAACWREKIPLRDWRGYAFYSFDLHIPEDDTYIGVIVQRSDERKDRMDRRYILSAGTYRLWFNLANATAKGGDKATLANITELEFFQSKPSKPSVLYIDSIRLTTEFSGDLGGLDKQTWVETLTGLIANPPVRESDGPTYDAAEVLSEDGQSGAAAADVLHKVAKAVKARAATASLSATVDADFADTGYGAMAAPPGEHVFFSSQPIGEAWQREATLDLLRGESRSVQVVVFPKPGDALTGVRVTLPDLRTEDGARLPAGAVRAELVGYVHLGESLMHQLGGFTDFGWYPDPILTLDETFDVTPPRELQPLLLTVYVPRVAKPGRYAGTLRIAPEGRPALGVDVAVSVHDAVMPVAPRLPQLLHCGIEEFFPEFRLTPANGELGGIYRWGSPVDTEKVKRYVDEGMNCFNLHRVSQFYLNGQCGSKGEEAGAKTLVDFMTRFYPDERMNQLSDLGLTQKAVFYGFDEVDVENPVWHGRIERVFGALKERYGTYGVRIATTARPWDSPEAWDLPVDIWIPLLREYDPVLARMARERGLEVWWYSIRWEIPLRPEWSRALMWGSFANEVDGWLYYHTYDWVDRDQRLADNNPLTAWSPLSEGTRGSYGTGAVVYWDRDGEPRPSLRLVNLREGLYDYDLLCLLRDAVEEAEPKVDKDDIERRATVARAREMLDIPWRATLNRFVVRRDPAAAYMTVVEMNAARAEALELLEALAAITEGKN